MGANTLDSEVSYSTGCLKSSQVPKSLTAMEQSWVLAYAPAHLHLSTLINLQSLGC